MSFIYKKREREREEEREREKTDPRTCIRCVPLLSFLDVRPIHGSAFRTVILVGQCWDKQQQHAHK